MKMSAKSTLISRFLKDEEKKNLLLRMRYGNLLHRHRSISPDHLRIDGQAVEMVSLFNFTLSTVQRLKIL